MALRVTEHREYVGRGCGDGPLDFDAFAHGPDRVSEVGHDDPVWVKRSFGKLVDEAGENLGQRGCGRHDA